MESSQAKDKTQRALARASWPIHVYKLGEESSENLSASTTVEERLAMMWPLALEAWQLSGKPLPTYSRETMPVSIRKL
jgi:hypothetical protein